MIYIIMESYLQKVVVVFNIIKRVMLVSRTWSWLCLNIVLIICSTLTDVSEAHQTALVGTVYCDTCFHQYFSKSSYFISGALVAVECGGHRVKESGGKPRFWKKVKTNNKGEFRVKLPFSATKNINEITGCSVKLISNSNADCAVAASTTSSSIRLKVKTPENHVFSAGFFMFRPLEQPKQCQMQSRNANSNDEFIAPTPLSSFAAYEMLAPSPQPSPTIPSHDLSRMSSFRFRYLLLPPSLIPSFQLQPPPDSMFNLDPQTPPDSMFNPGLQPPPDSMFNLDPQPPPASMLNPSLQSPPDSMFNLDPQPPSASMLNPNLQPPPDSMFNLDPQPPPASMSNPNLQPPPDSMFNPDSQPPPASVFDPMPLPTPPAPIFDTFHPLPPPPSLPIPPQDPQPDLIQSTPPPPLMPPGALLPPFPPFPFQPRQGLPRMPPATYSAHQNHILV